MKPIKILNDLIAIDSRTSKTNSKIISYIQEYYLESEKYKYFVNGIEMNNLVVKIEGKSNQPLIFVSHSDTVEIQEDWRTNPLIPHEYDKKIYGLGASDMKGSIACLISSSLDCKPIRDVYLIFVGSEENNSQGARNLIDNVDFPKSQIIIPEPTNRFIHLNQRGYLEAIVNGRKIQKRFGINDRNNFYKEESTLIKLGGKIIYSNPPSRTLQTSSLVKTLKSIKPSLKISSKPFKGWTEAGLFRKFGDAIIFGAGDYNQCHKPNEYIKIDDLDLFTHIFNEIINYKS